MTVGKRALVTLPDGVWKVIDNELKGQIGDGDSEVIRNIVISYLTEKGYLMKAKPASAAGPESMQYIEDKFLSAQALFDVIFGVLIEKAFFTQEEVKRRVFENYAQLKEEQENAQQEENKVTQRTSQKLRR